tara:strand:+ start:300 stop:620 length:321 start_codon:yes stop_codon:yes gene_type:complete
MNHSELLAIQNKLNLKFEREFNQFFKKEVFFLSLKETSLRINFKIDTSTKFRLVNDLKKFLLFKLEIYLLDLNLEDTYGLEYSEEIIQESENRKEFNSIKIEYFFY